MARTKKPKPVHHAEDFELDPLSGDDDMFRWFLLAFMFGKDNMSELTNKMSYNKVLVLNIGFDRASESFKDEHWIYYPSKDLNFYRIGFYNNILQSEELSVYVEIGYPKDGVIDVDKELKEALEGMKKVGITDDDTKMVDYSYVIMDPAYVHISEETEHLLNQKKQSLLAKGIHTTGRYGKWTYSSMEDCMIWAKEIADSINS